MCLPYLTWDCVTQLGAETGNKPKSPKLRKCLSSNSKNSEESTNATRSTGSNNTTWTPPSSSLLSNPLCHFLCHFDFCCRCTLTKTPEAKTRKNCHTHIQNYIKISMNKSFWSQSSSLSNNTKISSKPHNHKINKNSQRPFSELHRIPIKTQFFFL